MFRLDGRVAIVTGASSGLGVVFARELEQAGADVALGARREDRMAETKEAVEAAGRRAITVRTDEARAEERQADRKSVQRGKRVDLGGRRSIKRKKINDARV